MNIEDPKSIAPALETLRAFPDALATAAETERNRNGRCGMAQPGGYR